jgi:phosphatidylglycerophosphate synthase
MTRMPQSKKLADLLTLARAGLPVALVWVGITRRLEALPVAVYLLIASWTSDSLDGPLARRGRVSVRTWLGEHDLEIDMAVSAGLLAYMVLSGLVHWSLAVVYVLCWSAVFWRFGLERSLGMVVQGPVYGFFVWQALVLAPEHGRWLPIWLVAAIIVSWPKFPRMVVPTFLANMRDFFRLVVFRRS